MSDLAGTVVLVVICVALAVVGAWHTTKTRQRHSCSKGKQPDRKDTA